jgi:hypothetical protein
MSKFIQENNAKIIKKQWIRRKLGRERIEANQWWVRAKINGEEISNIYPLSK